METLPWNFENAGLEDAIGELPHLNSEVPGKPVLARLPPAECFDTEDTPTEPDNDDTPSHHTLHYAPSVPDFQT